MHPNPIFRSASQSASVAFLRGRSFGTLSINGDVVPLTAHVPFLTHSDASALDLHLVRSNPIARALKAGSCMACVTVTGADSYVSPDWYDLSDQVPTWNYVALRITGRLELRPQDELRGMIDALSQSFESRLAPKTPWHSSKMSEDSLAKMMRMIVPLRLSIDDIQSTWKLGQNKPDAARKAAADHIRDDGIGSQTQVLAQLMQDWCPEPSDHA